jgi:hypothetical protein
MSYPDRRERPWKKLRVIVEVTVPPNSRATEKDLMYFVSENLPRTAKLPRPIHANFYEAVVRFKSFASFWPAFLRKEKGIKTNFHRKKETEDVYHGL